MSVVKINAITVPKDRAEEFEARFAARAGAVSGSPGFEAFELMCPVDGRDVYLVYTRWRSEEDFVGLDGEPRVLARTPRALEHGPVSTPERAVGLRGHPARGRSTAS